jgi:cytochrome bd-type quinol oxidase subunit 1
MEAWVFFHGLLGVVLVGGMSATLWEALARGRHSLRALRIATLVILLASVAKIILGDLVYVPYRKSDPGSPRSLILAGNRPWVHTVLMEFKEHVAHFLPLILLVCLVILYAYGEDFWKEAVPRRAYASLMAISLLITVAALLMGAFITGTAPLR